MHEYMTYEEELSMVEAEAAKEGMPLKKIDGSRTLMLNIIKGIGFASPNEVRSIAKRYGHFV